MTLLPSPLAQSTLGEKAALYFDQVTDNLPVFLESLRPRLDPFFTYSATSLRSAARALPFDVDEQTGAVYIAVFLGLITVAVMSWANPLSGFWRRDYSAAPKVNDEDFSYITPNDIVDPPYNAPRYESQRYEPQHDGGVDENEPDVICLRHRGTIYPLRFRAYAIDDGLLTVGALRQEAAAQTGAGNPDRVRLLYKGNLLKDDSRSCKAEGLKQHSEVLCVVSEVGASTSSDVSDGDAASARPGSSSSQVGDPEDEADSAPVKKRNRNRGKKNKKNKAPPQEAPAFPPRPASTPTPSSTPPPPPNLKQIPTAMEQVSALSGYLQRVLIPMCDDYLANPPTDPKKREYEYRKLSETILAQIMLKADGIEPDGNVDVRNARKALIHEAQSALNRIDQVNRD
ncbi:hypothetical protein N7468_003925 [Penicillium chermesinum]|uniref:BAG domain-containing protein n=1 Tax=Penicillium chermesinum TaxID=63820 RepID=A0A9W9P861_9EURO|nr:uncharacterized protein N7468_003925 [Penicillium chermesinum]KAJ5239306.1 hypothetical protein N7468_003925 [Penicillium chermesinum]